MYPDKSMIVYMHNESLNYNLLRTACVTGITDMLIHCKKNDNWKQKEFDRGAS